MNQILQYLAFSNYRKYLRPAVDGCMGLMTHVAEITWSDGIQRESYVKFYGEQKKRALLNEAIGYLLISGLRLPQPEFAGFLEFKISEKHTPEIWEKVSDIDRYRGVTYAWVCTNTNGINRRIELDNASSPEIKSYLTAHIVEALKSWEKLPNLIMCDDWLANNDRNLGNLLELPNRTFTLIDHGGILYGDNWSPWDIMRNATISGDFQKMYMNLFKQKFEGLFWKENLLADLKSAKKEHESAFELVKGEIHQLIVDFLGEEKINTGLPPNPIQNVSNILQDFLASNAVQVNNIEAKCDLWLSATPCNVAK